MTPTHQWANGGGTRPGKRHKLSDGKDPPCFMGQLTVTISMIMFNSYVQLPEGRTWISFLDEFPNKMKYE